MSTTPADRIRVLHVDDHPGFADVVAKFLERTDDHLAVSTATSVTEGLEILEEEAIDCVVSDYEMGDHDGLDFLRTVRERHGDLPFILFTGKGSEEIASDAISAGVSDYLQKRGQPDQYELLANRIRNYVVKHWTECEMVERERELVTAKKRLQIALSGSDTGVWEWYPETDEVVWDQTVERLFGLAPGEFEGTYEGFVNRVVAADRSRVGNVVGEGLGEDGQFSVEFRIRRSGGEVRWIEASGATVEAEGEPVVGLATDVTDRKEREFELVAERERHAALFENTTDAVVLWEWVDEEPVAKRVNPAFERLFGYDAGEAVGQSIDDLVVPSDDLERATRINERVLSGELVEVEVTRLTADGQRDFVLHSVPLSPEDARIESGFAVYRDVTELREQERRFRTLLEDSSDITAILDAAGTVEYVTPSLRYVLGYDPSDLLGETVFDRVHPVDLPEVTDRFEELVDDPDASPQIEFRYRSADGEWIRLEARGRNLMDEPLVEGVVVYVRDITERQERQETIQKYRAIVQNTSDAAFVLDAEGRIEFVNRAVTELTGTPIETILGQPISLVPDTGYVGEDDYREFEAGVERLSSGSEDAYRARLEIDLEDGPRWFEFVLTRLAEGETTVGIVGTARDVTDRVDYERVLERQNQRLEEFASVVSHDLRNPIEVARGALARYRESSDPAYADRVDDSLGRMDDIVSDVLTLAREGQRVEDLTPVSLGVIADRAWGTVTGDGRLIVDAEDLVLADADRLQRLLENLFNNAVQHGSAEDPATTDDAVAHGHPAVPVTVTVRSIPGGFAVDDDGAGIDPDDADRIFEAGYSSDREGTGLGLNIVQTIVESHDWTIGVEESPEGGTRIAIEDVVTVPAPGTDR